MKEKIMSIKEIANIVNAPSDTIRTYLARATFDKYARNEKINNFRQLGYVVNNDFINDLCNFLQLKRRYSCIKSLQEYITGEKKVNIDLVKENQELKQQLEMVCKQYNSLLNHHNECLKAFKNDLQNNEIIKS